MSLVVKIQQLKVKFTSGADVAPIVDITDRLPIDQLRSLTERIESGRFAFTTSDVDIQGVANHDDFIGVDSDYVDVGLITYIEYEGTEIFRGISTYEDFSFEDSPIKTARWRSFDWLKRLRTETLTDWEAPLTLGELDTEIDRILRLEPSGLPRFSSPVLDYSGVLDIDFDMELGDENPIEGWNYSDVWRDPRNGKIWAIRYNPDEGASGSIELYRPKGNRHELVRSWLVQVFGVVLTDVSDIGFFRAICTTQEVLAFHFTYEYTDTDGRTRTAKRAYVVDIDDLTTDYSFSFSGSPNKHFLTGSSAPINAGESVCSDGQYLYYRKEETDGTIYIEKRTQSRAYIGRADLPIQPNSLTAIDAPYANTIVYHNGIRWYWFRWTTAGDFVGSISVGDTLPERNYTEIYPVGYAEDEYMGKYHYYNWRDLPGILDLDEWWTNDPLFIILSAMYYEEVTIEDLLTDIAQFFNGYFFHRNGIVYVLNRGDYANDHTISEDFIYSSKYSRTLKDDSKVEPVLNLKALGVSDDDDDDPYNTRTLAGALRSYYRDTAQAKWIRRQLTIPLTVGKSIRLGDRLQISETKKQGVVIERKIDLSRFGKMAEFLIEYEDTT